MYYNIDNPIVDYAAGENPEDNILAALRPQGIVNGEINAIELLDKITKSGKSSYIPIAYNKDGSLAKTSSATTESRLRLLGEYSAMKLTQLGGEITGGKVAPNPYPDSCDYCPYKLVCGFDLEKGRYRKPTKLKNDDECYEMFNERVKKDGKKLD